MSEAILRLLFTGAVAVSAQAPAPAPSAPAGGLVVVGRVVAASTGEPIRNARVTLSPASKNTPVVLTDEDGTFRFAAPTARYRVVASKTGYARAEAPPPAAGEPVEVRLKRGAAIAGRILDEHGEPVVDVKVSALTRASVGNDPMIVASVETDDRGGYRFAGLPEGAFAIAVTTFGAVGARPTARIPQPTTTYYPSAVRIEDAESLSLRPGDERQAADIVVPGDRLAGTPAGLFNNRFLPRPPPVPVQLGLVKPVARPTGSIHGRVVDIDGTPISLVQVYLFTGSNTDSRMVTTDDSGRFSVDSIVAGPLLVSAVKSGYAQVESRRTLRLFQIGRAVTSPSPNDVQYGRRLELGSDESRSVDLQMAHWSTLSGRVTDENGDPLEAVEVNVLQVRYEAGRRWLMSAGTPRLTDDRGAYRLHGLSPGRYIVAAAVGQVSSDNLPGYDRTYFPGTANSGEAQYVSVGLAQDVGFVDFSMARARTLHISGVVLGSNGEPSMPGGLKLLPSQSSSSATNIAVGAQLAADGTFVFPNVALGQYVIQASRGRPNAHAEGEFGSSSVRLDTDDVTGVVVRMSPGSSIAGRFRFDVANGAVAQKPAEFELLAIPTDLDLSPNIPASADIHGNWTFDMHGLNGPRRLGLVRTPPGLALKEIRLNGVDLTDKPIPFGTHAQSLSNVDVVLTDRVGEVNGRVVDDRGRPLAGAAVIIFSTDRQHWYQDSRHMRRAAAGQDGAFTVVGLPPGSYYASTATLAEAGEDTWQDPEFLESLVPGAITVTVVEGLKTTLALSSRGR